MVVFDEAAGDYDAARPSYPAGLYDLIESLTGVLAGRQVLDAGAGTGVATRQIADRGASVTALDAGVGMLRQALDRTPHLRVVAGDASAIPLRASCIDLVCFAQSWHWIAQAQGAAEAARVLRPAGWWAAWWNHPWADGETWFDAYQGLLERTCPAYSRDQRDVDWGAVAIAHEGRFDRPERHVVSWSRTVRVRSWMTDLSSHSYVLALPHEDRQGLMGAVEAILRSGFPDDQMVVPYQTRLWLARRS